MNFECRVSVIDWSACFMYLTEIARENTVDLPKNVENWSVEKLLKKIHALENKFGPMEFYA
jgi:hypothetical protein